MRNSNSNPFHLNPLELGSCQPVSANLQMLTNRRLRILFLKNQLSPDMMHFYFAGRQFVMPSDFDVPPEVLKFLGLEQYRIHTGIYQVHEDLEYIMLDV